MPSYPHLIDPLGIGLEPFSSLCHNSSVLLSIEQGEEKLLTVHPGGAVSLENGL